MNKNLFHKHFWKILISVFFLITASFHAQNAFTIHFPSPAENLTVCNSSSKLYVQLDKVGNSTTQANVTIQLAPGVEYVPGSLTQINSLGGISIVEDGGTANSPKFVINPAALSTGNRVTFSINRAATCVSRTHLLNEGEFADQVLTEVGTEIDSLTSGNYQVANTVLSITQPTTQTNAVNGSTYNRTFSVTNGGQGATDEVFFTVTNQSGVVTNSITLTAGNGSVGTPFVIQPIDGVYTVPSTQLSGGSLALGETLVFTENYTVLSCTDNITNYDVGWGCDPTPTSWCQTASGSATVTMAVGSPNLRVAPIQKINFVDSSQPFTSRFAFTNNGTGGAAGGMYNVKFRWGNGNTGILNQFNFNMQYTSFLNAEIGSQSGLTVHNGTVNGQIPYVDVENLFTTDPDGPGGLEDLDGDGFFDDLAPGNTVTIDILTQVNCSFVSCNQALTHNYFQWSDVRYTTMCSPDVFENSVARAFGAGLLASRLSLSDKSYAPATIYGGTPFTARFSMGYHTFSNNLDTNNTRYAYEITLPAGFSATGTTVKWYGGQYNGTVQTSQNISFSQTGQIITVTSPSNTMGWFEIELVYSCGVSLYNFPINYTVKRLDNIVTGASCNEDVFCSSIIIGQARCNTPCSTTGPTITFNKVERADNSLGWTDATLATKQLRSSISAYDLSKALYLDDINVYANGEYRAANTEYNQFYLYFGVVKHTPQPGNILTPQSIDVTVRRDGTTVGTYNLTTFTNTGSTNAKQVVRWDLSSLIANAGLQPNDVIETVAHYTVSGSSLPTQDMQSGEMQYFYNVNAAGEEVYCDFFVPQLYLVGTSWVDGTNSTNISGCSTGSIGSMTHYIGRRFNTAGTKFSSEVRPGVLPTRFTFTLPDGYALSSVNYYLDDVAGQGHEVLTSQVQHVSGNTYQVNLPMKALNITVTNNYPARIDVRVTPTCAVTQASSTYRGTIDYIDHYYHFRNNPPANNTTHTANRSVNYNLVVKPSISLTNISGTIQATKPTESVTVRLASTGVTDAPYVWLAVPTTTGVNITQIVNVVTGAVITPIPYGGGVWFKVSEEGITGTTDYRIDFTYTECNTGSFDVIGGWNCIGYPVDPSQAACTPYIATMNFIVQPASVQLSSVIEPTSPITLCTPLDYQFVYTSAGAGNLVNNRFRVALPNGLAITPGTLQVEYPLESGNWQEVSATTTGNVTILNLDTHPAYPTTGLPGTLNDGGDSNNRIMSIRFSATTTCNFTSGNFIRTNAYANRTCGQPASGNGVGVATSNLFIQGADPGYVLSTQVTNPNAPITSCDDDLTVNISQTVVLSSASGTPATARIRVIIPSGYDLVNTTPVCTTPGFCPTFISQGTDAVSGEKYALYQIPINMQTGETMEYQLTFVPNNTNTNGDFSVVVITEDVISGLTCTTAPGGACSSVTVQTSRGQYDFTLLCICYEDPAMQAAAVPSQHGITLLKRAGAENGNWPMSRQSAHTVLESNNKGFVITRMATTELVNITNPVVGMMVYDTTEQCLKIYTGPAATEGWKCFQRPACPQ